jgi:hypothetical protein
LSQANNTERVRPFDTLYLAFHNLLKETTCIKSFFRIFLIERKMKLSYFIFDIFLIKYTYSITLLGYNTKAGRVLSRGIESEASLSSE